MYYDQRRHYLNDQRIKQYFSSRASMLKENNLLIKSKYPVSRS
jgi:hypothetical protein